MSKIRLIADKIFPFKSRIEEIFKQALTSEEYVSYRILSLYVLYLRLILHQEEEALKMEDYIKVLLDRLRDSQEVKFRTTIIIQNRRTPKQES